MTAPVSVSVGGRAIVAGLAEVVDGDDVRVAQRGGGARLTTEALDEAGVGDDLSQKHFECHLVADVYAARAVDRAHAALAEPREQFVLAIEHLADERVKLRQSFGQVVRLCLFSRRFKGGEGEAAVGTESRAVFQDLLTFGTNHRRFPHAVESLWLPRAPKSLTDEGRAFAAGPRVALSLRNSAAILRRSGLDWNRRKAKSTKPH